MDLLELEQRLDAVRDHYVLSVNALDTFIVGSKEGVLRSIEELEAIENLADDPDRWRYAEPGARDAALSAASKLKQLYVPQPQMSLAMALSHAYALWEGVFFDLLVLAFEFRPEMLKNKQATLTYHEVLDFPSREELVEHLARTKAISLMYGRLEDRIKFIEDRLDSQLFGPNPDEEERRLLLIRDRRNLIVHNNSRIDKPYATKYGGVVGESIVLDWDDSKKDREMLSVYAGVFIEQLKWWSGINVEDQPGTPAS